MNESISSVHTSCKNCVFAKYENITQTSCELNYIEKFQKNNIQILEAYDNEKEFYIVNNKKCIGYREDKWFNQYGDEAKSLESKIKLYHEHNKLNYLAIINLINLTYKDLDDILNQLAECEIQPQKIIFIRFRDTNQQFKLDLIRDLLNKYQLTCDWRIQTMIDNTEHIDNIISNITSLNSVYRFILSISSYSTSIKQIISKANKIVHQDMGQIIVLSDCSFNNHNCVLYAGAVYRYHKAMENKNILQQEEFYQYL